MLHTYDACNNLHNLFRNPAPQSLLKIVWKIPVIQSCIRLNSYWQIDEWLTTRSTVTFKIIKQNICHLLQS